MSQRCLTLVTATQGIPVTRSRPVGSGRWCRLLLVCSCLALLATGCGRGPQRDATAELVASFEGSPAQDDVVKAQAAFAEGRYKDSLNLLHKVVARGDLTQRQKAAMAGIVGQLLQAIENDPKLSGDVQLHRSMELLILQTMGRT